MPNPPDISLKGLDTFSKKFLLQGTDGTTEQEYIHVSPGQKVSDEALKRYHEERQRDFIKRAGSFTEDLVAFIVEQKKLRQLGDTETVFAIALANINLRNTYGSPQDESDFTPEKRERLLDEFDEICAGAQDYYDANA
jgi:hypothetical protein